MKELFAKQAFTGLGPSRYRPEPEAPLHTLAGPENRKLRRGVRRECPQKPGVYTMVDEIGEVIYVGKAKNLRTRLLSYFRPKGRPPKATQILKDAHLIGWETVADEFASLLRELELIHRWKPRHNVAGQPRRLRRTYLCVGRRPAPYVFATTRPPKTAFAVFGPVPVGHTTNEAVRHINDWYRLRDCPQTQTMVFADQRELFSIDLTPACIRHDIGHCLAPCAAYCTQQEYQNNVDAVIAFLQGEDRTPLEMLERQIAEASAALQFERAGALNVRLETLSWLFDYLARLREATTYSFVYPITGADGRLSWYLIERGRVLSVTPAPVAEQRNHVAAEVERVFFNATTKATPLLSEDVSFALLVASWFRRLPEEHEKVLAPEEALKRAQSKRGEFL